MNIQERRRKLFSPQYFFNWIIYYEKEFENRRFEVGSSVWFDFGLESGLKFFESICEMVLKYVQRLMKKFDLCKIGLFTS